MPATFEMGANAVFKIDSTDAGTLVDISEYVNEVQMSGSLGYEAGVYETVIDLMARGAYPTTGWVEHIPWSALVDEGFGPLRRGERMKVMVDVGV